MTRPKRPDNDTAMTRQRAILLLRLFMACYKRGVTEAHQANDEGLCREVIEQTSQTCTFGLVSAKVKADPVYWQLRINDIADDAKLYLPWDRYCASMGRYGCNYLSVAMVLCQCFVNLGMEHYLDNPHSCDFALFSAQSRAWWTKDGIKSADSSRIVQTAQNFCYDRIDVDASGGKGALKEFHYKMFLQKLGMAYKVRVDY